MFVWKMFHTNLGLLGCKFSDFVNAIYSSLIMEGSKVFINKLLVVANISVIFWNIIIHAISFCLLHQELDKRVFSLHGNVANSTKISEMTLNIARLINNVTFHFLRLVLMGWLVPDVEYPYSDHNVNCKKKQ